jgi:hypothetical protein
MIPMHDDEDDQKDAILQMLGGEVDDYAGKQLPDPDAPPSGQGVTIEISVKPHGGPEDAEKPEGEEPNMEAENPEHDPIAHILGMCGGGCAG